MDLLDAATGYAQHIHDGKRLKVDKGKYFTHVKAVSRRLWTKEEKVVALLHDVVEQRVKDKLGATPNPKEEEECIKEILFEIARYFKCCNLDVADLIPDIDILTKRVTDANNYRGYIIRLADDAKRRVAENRPNPYRVIIVKLSDLHHNQEPDRNPAVSQQSPKDKTRLGDYGWAIRYLEGEFPDVLMRTAKPPNRRFRRPRRPGDRPPKGKKAPLIRLP